MATVGEIQEGLRRGLIDQARADELLAQVQPTIPDSPVPSQRSAAEIFGASAGGRAQLGVSSFNEALAATIGLPVDLIAGTIGLLGGPEIERPIGGSQQLLELAGQAGLTPQVQAPEGAVTEAIQAAGSALGASILPVGGTLAAGGRITARGLSAATPAVSPVAATLPRQIGRDIAQAAAARPGTTLAAEVGLAGATGIGEVAGAGVEQAITGEETGAGRLIGGIGASLSPLAIGGAIKGAARGVGNTRKITERNLAAFQRAGIEPRLGEITGARRVQFFERLLQKLPGSGRLFKAARETEKSLANRINTVTGSDGAIDPAVIGRRVVGRAATDTESATGLMGFIERFKGRSDVLFTRVKDLIGTDTRVSVSNTKDTLAAMSSPVGDATNLSRRLANKEIRGINEDFLADLGATESLADELPYEILGLLRSNIGAKIADANIISDIPIGELRTLYGALTRDMRAAAEAAGPEALQAFQRSNRFYAAGQKRIEGQINRFMDKANPEDIFQAIETGGRRGATRILAIRRSVTPEEWRLVSGAIGRRLGRSVQSQRDDLSDSFSTTGFLRRYGELDKSTKNALFGGQDGFKDDLDNLADISRQLGDLEGILANPSGTSAAVVGGGSTILATGAAFTGDLSFAAGLLGAVAATDTAARLMTNRSFVKYLTRLTRLPPERIPGQIARAAEIVGVNDPDINIAIQEFIRNLTGTGAEEESPDVVATVQ